MSYHMSIAYYRQALLWLDASLCPDGIPPDWLDRLAETGVEEAVVLTRSPLDFPGSPLTLRFVDADAGEDLLTAFRAARRLLTGPFAAMALGHPRAAHFPSLAAFHRQHGGPVALLLSPANGSARPCVLTDERSRVVRYVPAPEGQSDCRWQDAGLYSVGSEMSGFLKKEAARFPDLCRHFLSDAIPFYGMRIADESH